jgi:hypothetical protein
MPTKLTRYIYLILHAIMYQSSTAGYVDKRISTHNYHNTENKKSVSDK